MTETARAWLGPVPGMQAVAHRLAAESWDAASLLDVGGGSGVYGQALSRHGISVVCLDASPERLAQVPAGIGTICGRAENVLPSLEARSFDVVAALDFIEHMPKRDGLKLLEEFHRVAKKRVVVFTPLGFMPCQHQDELMCHQSGWLPEDLDALGFACDVWVDFDYGEPFGTREALWAIWNR